MVMTFAIPSTASFGQATETEDQVIFEDSFETGTKVPEGWKSGATIPGVKYLYDTKTGASGKRSLSLSKTANRYFPIAQWFRILPAPGSPSIRLTAKVKARKVTKAIFEIQFLGQDDQRLGKKWLAYIGAKKAGDKPVSHAWKEYGDVADVPPDTKTILIGLQIYGPGQVWFDDVKITPNAAGKTPVKAAATKHDAGTSNTAETVAATTIKVADVDAQYIYTPPRKPSATKRHGLLIVMPGGDGSAEFQPFVNRVHEVTTKDDVALAQPIAAPLDDGREVVWPSGADEVGSGTEQMVRAVVNDVSRKIELNPRRIFLLAWSSSGQAAYTTLLMEKTPVSGALIAMSVFKPDRLPPLKNADKRKFYLLHSPDDRVCPHRMAVQAKQQLSENGARVKLVSYDGGHGWRGDVFGNISAGLQWLEQSQSQ